MTEWWIDAAFFVVLGAGLLVTLVGWALKQLRH